MTSGPEWLDPVGDEAADRDAGAVQAALLTTYDPPDATLLVEDLLPRWFRLDREMSSVIAKLACAQSSTQNATAHLSRNHSITMMYFPPHNRRNGVDHVNRSSVIPVPP